MPVLVRIVFEKISLIFTRNIITEGWTNRKAFFSLPLIGGSRERPGAIAFIAVTSQNGLFERSVELF
jgi:hypothetical protein